MGIKDLEVARKAAKVLQPLFEQFAGESGGARVWVEHAFDEISFHLRVLVWSDKFCNLNQTDRFKTVVNYIQCFPGAKEFVEHFSGDNVMHLECSTIAQYEDRYFFTKPPFCHPKMG